MQSITYISKKNDEIEVTCEHVGTKSDAFGEEAQNRKVRRLRIHDVASVKQKTRTMRYDDGMPFKVRTLTVIDTDGHRVEIDLFLEQA